MKLELKQKVIKLREKGYSYSEIQSKLNVSKDTISRWVKNIELTKTQKEKIIQKQINGRILGGRMANLSNKSKYASIRNEIISQAISGLGKICHRDIFLTGIGLYAGDGTKATKTLEFTNGNPDQVYFMYDWFQKFLKVPKDKIHLSLWLHENNNPKVAEDYWINKLKIASVKKIYFIKNKSKSSSKYPYGIAKIFVYSTRHLYTILAWIDAIIIPPQSPLAQW